MSYSDTVPGLIPVRFGQKWYVYVFDAVVGLIAFKENDQAQCKIGPGLGQTVVKSIAVQGVRLDPFNLQHVVPATAQSHGGWVRRGLSNSRTRLRGLFLERLWPHCFRGW